MTACTYGIKSVTPDQLVRLRGDVASLLTRGESARRKSVGLAEAVRQGNQTLHEQLDPQRY